MAIEPCFMCSQTGHAMGQHPASTGADYGPCKFCHGVGFVESGEHLPPEARPIQDAAADWPEEPTQEMPAFRGRPVKGAM